MPETRTPPALRRPARPRPALILALLLGVPLAACQGTPPDAQAQTAGPVYVATSNPVATSTTSGTVRVRWAAFWDRDGDALTRGEALDRKSVV